MDWMAIMAEEKIREAIDKGELNHLPGAGKPLELDDDAGVPADLRVAYRLLKNAGVLPEEMQLRKDLVTLEGLLASCHDPVERKKLHGDLAVKRLRYQQLMMSRGWSGMGAFADYEDVLRTKLGVEKS